MSQAFAQPVRSFADRPLHFCCFAASGEAFFSSHAIEPEQGEMPDVIRRAHNLVSHPDMPSGVYTRMALKLEEQGGSGGYYLCQDERGRVVWLAVSLYASPGGLVACHFEVPSAALKDMLAVYAQLSAAECENSTDAQVQADSAHGDPMADTLKRQGLKQYRGHALRTMLTEVQNRYAGRGWRQFNQLRDLLNLFEGLQKIDSLGAQISATSERSRLIPYQLKLQAARLESGSGPISVIASNHLELTGSLLLITRDILSASGDEIDRVSDAMAYLVQSNHCAELLSSGKTCANTAHLPDDVIRVLHDVVADCAEKVTQMMQDIDKSALALLATSKRMRRALSAMEMTRLMCKVERANVSGPTEGLANIVDHLQETERTLTHVMSEIDDVAKSVLVLIKKLDLGAPRLAA